MNEFLQQFLIESRELVDQASDALLSLEQSPLEAEHLDAAFRAFHTLKGGAGIVEFPAMERAVHAAEEVLSTARSGKRALTPELVGHCLGCLDRVLQWLDKLEQTGELPAIPEQELEQVVARFGATIRDQSESRPIAVSPAQVSWITAIQQRNPNEGGEAKTAVRFTPASDCFYKGEDPIKRMTTLPGLLALELEPVDAWGPLETLDPFACNLIITALTAQSVQDASAHLQGHSGECVILSVSPTGVGANTGPLPQNARSILEEQVALLRQTQSENLVGRVGSAGLTAANVLLSCRRTADAALLQAATEESLREKNPIPLRDAISRALAMESTAPVDSQTSTLNTDVSPRTLRVDTARIDALVRLTGELTVAKNSIGHVAGMARAGNDSVASLLKNHHDILERLVSELQRSVLGMRVLPLRSVLQRFPRIVREMSSSLGKPVKLTIEGDETEADKAIVEMLFEPLLHIVRNAIDHGIEHSDERIARGKPAVSALRIRAIRQGDRVHIEVLDDGRGIDIDRVREVARMRSIVTDDALRVMTDAAVIDLVFAPGFSTATKVTELSGRGVGMDAVRSAVERVGGRASIESERGHGTTVRLSLPFSVMMTDVMTVEAGDQMFGIPLDVVVETVRVSNEAITGIGAGRAMQLRDRTIPVFDLGRLLGDERTSPTGAETLLVVVAFAGQLGGIQVERLGERMQVMLAPLEGLLSGTTGIAGTTLLGDGRVLLVLDVGEVLQ